MDQHVAKFCGTKARLTLACALENVGCSNKRLLEEGFKEVAMYEMKWQRFTKLQRRSSGLRMVTGRKTERFMILRQTGLLRIEGKDTSTGCSLFFVCSKARTVCYRTTEKL